MSALLGAVLAAGCAHGSVDAGTACRVARAERTAIAHMTARELAAVAQGSPEEPRAASARAQQVAAQVLSAVGMAAIAGGLIEGFAAGSSTDEAIRNGAYALGGTALGTLAAALVLSTTAGEMTQAAREELIDWAAHCRER